MTREEIVQTLSSLWALASRGTYQVDVQGSQQMNAILTNSQKAIAELAQENNDESDEGE